MRTQFSLKNRRAIPTTLISTFFLICLTAFTLTTATAGPGGNGKGKASQGFPGQGQPFANIGGNVDIVDEDGPITGPGNPFNIIRITVAKKGSGVVIAFGEFDPSIGFSFSNIPAGSYDIIADIPDTNSDLCYPVDVVVTPANPNQHVDLEVMVTQ